MIGSLQRLVANDPWLEWLFRRFDDPIAAFDSRIDEGKVYVVLDDRALIDYAGHYMIYGSEWISAVLGPESRRCLLERGSPTIIEIDLPLRLLRHWRAVARS